MDSAPLVEHGDRGWFASMHRAHLNQKARLRWEDGAKPKVLYLSRRDLSLVWSDHVSTIHTCEGVFFIPILLVLFPTLQQPWRPGRLLIVSTTDESQPMVIPFRCLFCAPLDGCYPPETFLDEMSSRTKTTHSRASTDYRSAAVSFPFWASLLSCVGLCTVTMGPSHLRLLTVFGEPLIMGTSWQLAHLRMMVGPLSFPLHELS